MIPTQPEIEDKLRGEDLDKWIAMWRTEQGPAKPAALALMASAIPFPPDRQLRILDIGCGTGDAGRAIHSRFPRADVDFVDRNLFFVSLCGAVNRRDGIAGRTLARDLWETDWRRDLASDYDAVVAVNSLHWLDLARGSEILREIFESLRPGGVFLMMEPVGVEPAFAAGFDAWRSQRPSQHNFEDWRRFWSRVKELIGYDYGFLGEPPSDDDRIGDGLPVTGWVGLLREGGFTVIDILLRDTEKVVLAAINS